MFGYIRPVRDKLSEDEYLRFRAMYCGICHNMGRRCGVPARFTVNYDFTFLAMLLSGGQPLCCRDRRCIAHPFKKRACIERSPALDKTSDFSVILTWWKLRDTAWDDGLIKRTAALLAMACLRRSFNKALRREPEFAKAVEENIRALSALENDKSPSIDMTADRFALILAAASEAEADPVRRRILRQLLYHTGRLIYIMDAVDDLPEDIKAGSYNPIVYRFRPASPELDRDVLGELERTQRHSINLMASAFQLLDAGPWTSILTNIIYTGIPATAARLLQRYAVNDETKDGDNT